MLKSLIFQTEIRVPTLIPVPDFRVSHFESESGSLRSWKDDRAGGSPRPPPKTTALAP